MFHIKINKIMPYVIPVIVIGLATMYYYFNPLIKSNPFQCTWRLCTGTQCPACGFQRALHALMHGHFLEALRYNFFFVVSIPYCFLIVLTTWYNYHNMFDKLKEIVFHKYTVYSFIILFCVWWIARNLLHI